ncbi:TPA: LuxR family transcriptional regulator [Legionella pneumophila]|uniref:helix-turn-helix transcriptional regulator n=1 Tax=Legionella pneumophila TaxID=446 RepID=UPI000786A7CB|nr:LuxR C-terminal-related transcriptional regulator [Legionella pneumophila]MDW8878058.1 LuxR C-terminal-related transcriptional regulator [Legionella pneumophila subsp. fraseri]MDW8962422.1 LuxR C-terminal-related transcriptional regulator [Legionella pneumophila subsp. fraseri]MDW9036072.1 LuxR C-terminal-related transcriptional regulator [Legionella pneumophila subsp. fraseri]MDW9038652.1 LuxR C-terminal-related transcriptional regulator [Legionella pneumophila subsp. fraseri]MDW9042500.1 
MNAQSKMKAYTSFLYNCYNDIFEKTPIDFWGYLYFDFQGRYLQLISEKSIIDEILNKELFIEQNLCKKNYQHDNFYVCNVDNDDVIAPGIKNCLLDRDFTYFVDIIHQDSNRVEMVTFASSRQPDSTNNFIFNNLDYLNMIAENLSSRARRLHTKDNFLTLPRECILQMNELIGSGNTNKQDNLKEIILRSSQKKMAELIKDNVFDYNQLPFSFLAAKDLTHREKEMIYLYFNDFNLSRIASIFEISKRTVERHFESIKKKLNCENVGQIIPALIKYDCSLKKGIKT